MTSVEQQAKDEILKLEAENASMLVKSSGVGMVGSFAGLYIAQRQKKGTWGKIGYFIAGGLIARTPLALMYADKMASNLARIQQLKTQYNL